MKALLDQQLSRAIAEGLRAAGLDVEAVTERPGLTGKSDQQILSAATIEGRAVVTNNIKDFRPLAARAVIDGTGHAGLILLPANRARTRDAVAGLVRGIAAVMHQHPDGIADSEHWVMPV